MISSARSKMDSGIFMERLAALRFTTNEFGRLLDQQISGLSALQNLIDIGGAAPEDIGESGGMPAPPGLKKPSVFLRLPRAVDDPGNGCVAMLIHKAEARSSVLPVFPDQQSSARTEFRRRANRDHARSRQTPHAARETRCRRSGSGRVHGVVEQQTQAFELGGNSFVHSSSFGSVS
jgi:hypothetical protein